MKESRRFQKESESNRVLERINFHNRSHKTRETASRAADRHPVSLTESHFALYTLPMNFLTSLRVSSWVTGLLIYV